jgi:hypothetical protein
MFQAAAFVHNLSFVWFVGQTAVTRIGANDYFKWRACVEETLGDVDLMGTANDNDVDF